MKTVDVWDYSEKIMKAVKKGVLLTTKADGRVNTMTISWGMLGIEWSRPIFITVVRESRFTKGFLDSTGVFTVNIPLGETDKDIIAVCGSKSGRDTDKIKELGLTLSDGVKIDVPAIKELPLTLECKVVYKQQQDPSLLYEGGKETFYADDDLHTAYYGEIVNAYIAE